MKKLVVFCLLSAHYFGFAQQSVVHTNPFIIAPVDSYDMHLLHEDTIWVSGGLFVCPECQYRQRVFTAIFDASLQAYSPTWNLADDQDYLYYMSNPISSNTFVAQNGNVVGINRRFRNDNNLDTMLSLLCEFDRSGNLLRADTLWDLSRYIDQLDYYTFRQGILSSDGNYVFTGQYRPYPQVEASNGFTMLTKITPDGEVLWVRSYPNTHEGIHLKEAADGGYYIGAWEWGDLNLNCIGSLIYDDQHVLLKTDSEGNEIKRLVFGTPYQDANVDIIEENDRLILLGTIASGTGGQLCDNQNFFTLTVHETDTGFEMVEMKKYLQNSPTHNYRGSFKIGSDYYIYGYTRDYPTPFQKGLLLKLDANLNLQWQRNWFHYSNNDSQHSVTRMTPLPNGGFLGLGFTRQDIADPIPFLREAWLFKLDSDGCLIPGCAVGVENVVMGLTNAMQLYPNPANGSAHVRISLPDDYPSTLSQNHRLVVTDFSGKQVSEFKLPQLQPGKSHTEDIDLTGLSAGIYHIHWAEDTNWLSGIKLVIEK